MIDIMSAVPLTCSSNSVSQSESNHNHGQVCTFQKDTIRAAYVIIGSLDAESLEIILPLAA